MYFNFNFNAYISAIEAIKIGLYSSNINITQSIYHDLI
jgi:hypothetical protein